MPPLYAGKGCEMLSPLSAKSSEVRAGAGQEMTDRLFFDDIRIGDRWISPSRVVSSEDVLSFAQLTGDHNPLHVDQEFAKNSPFRKPIAHGLLGISFVAGLGSHSPFVETAAFVGVTDWKFLKPIYFGDRVHVVTEVVEREQHGRRRGRVVWLRSLINQHGETVQAGLFETLVCCRTTARSDAAVRQLQAVSE